MSKAIRNANSYRRLLKKQPSTPVPEGGFELYRISAEGKELVWGKSDDRFGRTGQVQMLRVDLLYVDGSKGEMRIQSPYTPSGSMTLRLNGATCGATSKPARKHWVSPTMKPTRAISLTRANLK